MFELTLLLLRAMVLACRGHHDVVLENLALRHQLRTLQRRVTRPHLRSGDRMFWVLLATAWRRWRSALVLVQPETVVRWHRTWLRRRWAQRTGRNCAGRPPLDPAVARLLTDACRDADGARRELCLLRRSAFEIRSGARPECSLPIDPSHREWRRRRADGLLANDTHNASCRPRGRARSPIPHRRRAPPARPSSEPLVLWSFVRVVTTVFCYLPVLPRVGLVRPALRNTGRYPAENTLWPGSRAGGLVNRLSVGRLRTDEQICPHSV